MGNKKTARDIALALLSMLDDIKTAIEGMLETTFIIYQPKTWTGAVGDTVVISVKAMNVSAYRWQYSTDGSTWSNSSSSVTGYNTDTVSFTMEAALAGSYRRCRLTIPGGGYLYTDAVQTLLVENEGG